MPNSIGPTGLTVKTRDELRAFFVAAFQSIYGSDINLDQDSPDGQAINIFIQAILDQEDLLVQINNQFDPDFAFGKILDQRVAINGIQRQAGTFTITPITVVVSQALTLDGLDQNLQPVFTVADNAGNQWQLQATQNIVAPGTYSFLFQAKNPGAVLTIPNTITNPVTIVLGVTSINNPSALSVLGINEETDAALKIRRQQSVALASMGYLASLLAALKNIDGMGSVFIYENVTGSPDIDGVPGHSIWVIVSGTAAVAEIADAIYKKRNAGCGMFGDTTFTITQVDGSPFIVRWDDVALEPLFIKFNVTSLDGLNPPDIAGIRAGLVTNFVPGVFEKVNINDLATAVQEIDGNTLVTQAGFSDNPSGPFTDTRTPVSKKNQFEVTAPNIIILPMILSPTVVALSVADTQQFTPLGGYGGMTYTIPVNNSGGSINGSGLYTAGASSGVDTVRVTDALGNFAEATVTVT